MQEIFLKDGRIADLVAKTEKGYIVDPHRIYHDYETKEEYTEASGRVEVVDEVFESSPRDLIEAEYQQVLAKVEEKELVLEEKSKELRTVEYELKQIQKQKTDAAKMIINREELTKAKRLTIWIRDQIEPKIMDVKNPLKLTISYNVSQWDKTEENCWFYACYTDHWSSYGEYYDPIYGIKADLSDEEILQITHERQSSVKFEPHSITCTADKWLTPENLQKKAEILANDKVNELKRAEAELIITQQKIEKLKSEVVTS